MKKLMSLALVVMFLLSIATMGFAEGVYNRDPGYRVKILNLADVALYNATLSSTIITGNSVLGFTFTDSSAGSVVLYDVAAAASRGNSTIFGEVKVAAGTSQSIFFPFPKKIDNGFVAASTNQTGALMVYYE